jgi:hypothetical protein
MGFEPTTATFELKTVHALDRAETVIGNQPVNFTKHGPLREANCCTASQSAFHIVQNLKVHV